MELVNRCSSCIGEARVECERTQKIGVVSEMWEIKHIEENILPENPQAALDRSARMIPGYRQDTLTKLTAIGCELDMDQLAENMMVLRG